MTPTGCENDEPFISATPVMGLSSNGAPVVVGAFVVVVTLLGVVVILTVIFGVVGLHAAIDNIIAANRIPIRVFFISL